MTKIRKTPEGPQMFIEVEGRSEIERLVAVLSLGLCVAMESKCLAAQEAEGYLFGPSALTFMQSVRASEDLVNLINYGMSIETCEQHFPDVFESSLITMKSLALSVLRSLPQPAEWPTPWPQSGGGPFQDNPIQRPLASLLNELDTISPQQEELGSDNDDVNGRLREAIRQGFIVPAPDYSLPQEFGFSSSEGNSEVREALSRFLASPEVTAARTQLQTPEERLEAFQDPYVRSEEGAGFDMYFQYRAEP